MSSNFSFRVKRGRKTEFSINIKMHAKEFVAKTGRGHVSDKKSNKQKTYFFVFPLTLPLVSLAIYLLHPLHPMYHMIPVLALTSPPIVLFLPYTWYTPCRITSNPFLCILIFLLLLYPLYSPSELEDKVSRQRHLLPRSTAMTRKMNRQGEYFSGVNIIQG